jgi:hypothetical protein
LNKNKKYFDLKKKHLKKIIMTWNMIVNMEIAMSLTNLPHQQKLDQIELGDQN